MNENSNVRYATCGKSSYDFMREQHPEIKPIPNAKKFIKGAIIAILFLIGAWASATFLPAISGAAGTAISENLFPALYVLGSLVMGFLNDMLFPLLIGAAAFMFFCKKVKQDF